MFYKTKGKEEQRNEEIMGQMDRDRSGKEDSGGPDPGCDSWNRCTTGNRNRNPWRCLCKRIKGYCAAAGILPGYQFSV